MKAKRINEVLSSRQKEMFKKRSDIDTKRFIDMVNEEWDIESLDFMIEFINTRKEFLSTMIDKMNPRNKIKGFRK